MREVIVANYVSYSSAGSGLTNTLCIINVVQKNLLFWGKKTQNTRICTDVGAHPQCMYVGDVWMDKVMQILRRLEEKKKILHLSGSQNNLPTYIQLWSNAASSY